MPVIIYKKKTNVYNSFKRLFPLVNISPGIKKLVYRKLLIISNRKYLKYQGYYQLIVN